MIEEYLQLEKDYDQLMEKQAEIVEKVKELLVEAIKKYAIEKNIIFYPTRKDQIEHFQFNLETKKVSVRWSTVKETKWDVFWFELPLEMVIQ